MHPVAQVIKEYLGLQVSNPQGLLAITKLINPLCYLDNEIRMRKEKNIKQLGESEEIKDYQAKIQLWKA